MSWDDADFYSDDPLVRFNAHQAAKGNPPLPDPDQVRKARRERFVCESPLDAWIADQEQETGE